MTRKLGSAIVVLSVLWAVTSLALKGGIGLTGAEAGPISLCEYVNDTSIEGESGIFNQTDVFSVGYYNLGPALGPVSDNTVNIINPATTGESTCANIYVFDSNQNMLACCSCSVSPNGLLTLSVKNDLLNKSIKIKSGVIEVVSSCSSPVEPVVVPDGPSVCSASGSYYPSSELTGWIAHGSGSISTEVELKHVPLSCFQLDSLQTECGASWMRSCSCPAGTP